MPLAQLLYPPPTDQGLDEWFHAHVRHHEALNAAITVKTGLELQFFPIFPVRSEDLSAWNRAHQALHNQMNQALNIAGADISTLDLKSSDKTAWFFQHFIMHQGAAELCGQPV